MSGEHRSHIVNERRIMAACVSQPFSGPSTRATARPREPPDLIGDLDGQDLLSLLTQTGFGRNVATLYLSEILVSLEYLHNLGIIPGPLSSRTSSGPDWTYKDCGFRVSVKRW